jgi:hypothetical protein
MEVVCIARSLLFDAECRHNHVCVKRPKHKHLMENYRVMSKQSETKVKNELTYQERL